ncbi:MAG: nicotinate-nucleotide adenylyltransferase [Candidatus Omnitrophica bacterium]|nr:nicotinate-nucleotide adenylyltransferase [Candidatus Omnitrophota bacterium]
MKRIGILGGTFNPLHIGHLAIAQVALEKKRLDSVVFVPSFWPPHKSTKNVISAKHRYSMVRLAIEDNPYFDICDYEIKRRKKSYSIDTVRFFEAQYPEGAKFFFIIGEDSLETLQQWRDIDEILKIVSFVVVNRPGMDKGQSKIKVSSVTMPGLDVSSSYIRKRTTSGNSIHYLVPPAVCEYIKKHHLYEVVNFERS